MKAREAVELARAALAHWGLSGEVPRLVKKRENIVFEVRGPEGRPAALRLHRPGYQSGEAIRSEMLWTEWLHAAGMDVPRPLRTLEGDLIAQGTRVASLVTWCTGVPLGEGGKPLPWEPAQQIRLYNGLGRALARLHNLSDAMPLPAGFTRPRLDRQSLLGKAPHWGRFWENPALGKDGVALLQEARSTLSAMLEPEADCDFGLIHADALRENVLVEGNHLRLIDFDDGAFGYRMYDLGVAMAQNWQEGNAAALADALLEGYASERPLPGDPALLHAFITLRTLASCGWVIGRYGAESREMALYGARAVEAARRFLKQDRLY